MTDGYNGNSLVKRDGVTHNYTKEEITEYQKCMNDPAYFARTYAKIINLDKGLVPFDLYPYQEKMFKHFNDNRFSVILACRQSGKSISSVIYILWYAIFHPEKTIAVLANKGATAREMLARITLALENLPFFLQPGCRVLNKGSLEFSNNSKIIAAATSASSIRGQSVNLLFLDEFAFVENASTFYTSTYPVISSGKETKVIITSTPNGIGNMFYKIWEGAVQGANEFKSFRVDWWDVPGRDELWKKQTISNTSETQFAQEFGNQFVGSSTTLISADCLLGMKAKDVLKSTRGIKVYNEVEEGHSYIMTVDVSKGRGQDYSTFSVIDITSRPFKQVCTYRDNMISPLLFPDIIVHAAKNYNEAIVIVENNDTGQVVCNGIYYDLEYENTFVESAIKKGGIGVTMTKKIKRMGCSNMKDLLEQNGLEIVDADTILELSTFVPKGNSYEADKGCHDDMVMNLVMFAWFVSTDAFGGVDDETLKQMLYKDREAMLDEEMLDFGFISTETNSSTADYEQMIADQKAWKEL
tara:strand:+ start:11998 stop:13575 length:1578 start_codon:yes stop_codon:yes gene_type:complete